MAGEVQSGIQYATHTLLLALYDQATRLANISPCGGFAVILYSHP